jgi:glycosyltransferase involved in cell wall biosynthesis
MKKLLHISYDFSETNDADKTTAIGDLLGITNKFLPSLIISLDRTSNPFEEKAEKIREDLLYLKVFGLPFGLFLKWHLKRVAKKILKASSDLSFNLSDVSLIHGHKLSYEGYIGYLLSKRLKANLFVSLRQTDFRVYRFRPDLRNSIKQVLRYSSKIFYIVPYMTDLLENQTGKNFYNAYIRNKLIALPNRINRKNKEIKYSPEKSLLVTALRIDKKSVKRKRIRNLFIAISKIKNHSFRLLILGDGPYRANLENWVKEFQIENKVEFKGKIPNDEIDMYLQKSEAFILPSKSETFGLVYGEALINETPILYSKNTGFDGFFDNVGFKVDPDSPDSIAEGILDILEKNTFYRDNIKKLKKENAFRIFTPEFSEEVYQKALNDANIVTLN